MGKRVFILLGIFLAATCVNLWAQKKGKPAPEEKMEGKQGALVVKTPKRQKVCLGGTDFCGGLIKASLFDSLMKKGLSSKDSLGRNCEVLGFKFTYAERNFYEDSLGNMTVAMDYAEEYCPGSTFPTDLGASLYERIKAGDTVFFDHIYMAKPHTTAHVDTMVGAAFKCTITK